MNEVKGIGFLNEYTAKSTVKVYKTIIKKFLKTVYGEGQLETVASDYFRQEHDYEEDVKRFFITIKDNPPKSIQQNLSIVKMFLLENKVEFDQAFWRGLRRRFKGTRAVTVDKVPSNEELRRILLHLPLHGKALFTTLSSSGMRIGETLQLKMSDVELDKDPAIINIKREYTKSGNGRIAFISNEAKEIIKEWLTVKGSYVATSVKKSTLHDKTKNNEYLFPFTDFTALEIWNRALDKVGLNQLDDATHRHVFHPHCLRKFFRTQLGAIIPVDIVEALMGHEGYLTEVYRKYSVQQLAEYYKKGEHVLAIFGTQDITAIQHEVKTLETKVQTSQDTIIRNERVVDKLLENGDAKDRQITALSEQVKEMKQQLDVVNVVHTKVMLNLLEQLPEDKKANLKELADVLKEKLKK